MRKVISILVVLIFSLGIASSVSGLFALAGWLLGHNLWVWFIVSFGVQYIIGGMWNLLLQRAFKAKNEQINALNILAEATKHVELPCAYCNLKNVVPIVIGQNNQFNCKHCKGLNRVDVNYSVIRTTEPLPESKVLKQVMEKVNE